MKLGGSLERGRRRRRSGGERSGLRSMGGGARLALATLALVWVGWGVGFLVGTRVLVPAPPPMEDLLEVPDLRGLGLDQARATLADAGLTLGEVASVRHPAVPEATVFGQSPLPGQAATVGSAVGMTVSAGPERQPVPDVRGLMVDQARLILQTGGFEVTVDSTESEDPRGRVLEISPAAETRVALPAQVRIVLSAGPRLVRMPDLLGLAEADAIQILDSLGLAVADIDEVFRFGRDQGIVVAQDPSADLELQRGTAVRLSVGRRGSSGGGR